MYFTRLVADTDGIEDWPAQVRAEMDPALLAELDTDSGTLSLDLADGLNLINRAGADVDM
ncbi:MAG: hypothetical protein IH921_09645 [Gemmatimonadetes bacterium]|nr:hypothetical protein [Gemmatimonadota bacterium]